MSKEQRGIHDVTFGDKKATLIFKDIEAIEDAVIEYIAMYVKGYHSAQRDKGFGAEHIKLHLEKGSEGEISLEELLNIGNSLRTYLNTFKEPFIDDKGAKIYEWENVKGVRFRVVAATKKADMSPCDNCTATHTLTNQGTNTTSIAPTIITFYSDRNLNKQMEFKNPKVAQHYASAAAKTQLQASAKSKTHKPYLVQQNSGRRR